MDVADQLVGMTFSEFEDAQHAAGIAGEDKTAILLDGKSHQRVSAGLHIRHVIDVVRVAVGLADLPRHTEEDVSGDRSEGNAKIGRASCRERVEIWGGAVR